MRTLRHDDPNFAAALQSLNRRATPAPHVAEAVAAITAAARSIDARTQHATAQ